jgi:hypothetical protein
LNTHVSVLELVTNSKTKNRLCTGIGWRWLD